MKRTESTTNPTFSFLIGIFLIVVEPLMSLYLWPGNRVAICVAPAQKELPSSRTLPQSTKHFATFAADNAFPYNAMSRFQSENFVAQIFGALLDASAHCCTALLVNELI